MWPMRSARQLLYPIRLVATHATEPLLQAPARSSFLFHSEAQIDGDSSDAELLRTNHQVPKHLNSPYFWLLIVITLLNSAPR